MFYFALLKDRCCNSGHSWNSDADIRRWVSQSFGYRNHAGGGFSVCLRSLQGNLTSDSSHSKLTCVHWLCTINNWPDLPVQWFGCVYSFVDKLYLLSFKASHEMTCVLGTLLLLFSVIEMTSLICLSWLIYDVLRRSSEWLIKRTEISALELHHFRLILRQKQVSVSSLLFPQSFERLDDECSCLYLSCPAKLQTTQFQLDYTQDTHLRNDYLYKKLLTKSSNAETIKRMISFASLFEIAVYFLWVKVKQCQTDISEEIIPDISTCKSLLGFCQFRFLLIFSFDSKAVKMK